MPSNCPAVYDERMYPALRSAALETLFDLMDNAESDSDRRMAATAALRYLAAVEDPRRKPPPQKSPPPAAPPPVPGPRPSSAPTPNVPNLSLTHHAPVSTPRAAAATATPAAGPLPPAAHSPLSALIPAFRINPRSPALRAGAAP